MQAACLQIRLSLHLWAHIQQVMCMNAVAQVNYRRLRASTLKAELHSLAAKEVAANREPDMTGRKYTLTRKQGHLVWGWPLQWSHWRLHRSRKSAKHTESSEELP